MSMGLEKVIEKIQKEGKEKITSILQDAEKQAAQILQTKQKMVEELSVNLLGRFILNQSICLPIQPLNPFFWIQGNIHCLLLAVYMLSFLSF